MSLSGNQDGAKEASQTAGDHPKAKAGQPRLKPSPIEPDRRPTGLPRAEIIRAGVRRLKRKRIQGFDLSAIDDALKREGLLRDRFRESIPPNEDAAISFSLNDEGYCLPPPSQILDTPEKRHSFWILCQIEPERLEVLSRSRREVSIPSSLAYFGPRPSDLKHSHLKDLFDHSRFEDAPDSWSKLVAYLVLKGFTKREELKQLVPELNFNQFHRLQAEIHAEVERTLPKRSRKFLTYLENLTEAQREAVERYHLKNDELLSKAEIAESIGISIDALKDRLEGAMKRLLRHFRPLVPSRTARPKYWKTLFQCPDTRDDGMFAKSQNQIHPVFRVGPKTRLRIGEIEPNSSRIRTPHAENRAKKEWLRVTSYQPRHDGAASALLAHLPNAYRYRGSNLKNSHSQPVWTPGIRTSLDQLPPKPKKQGEDYDYIRWRDNHLLGQGKGKREEEPWTFDGGWDFESQWDE